MTGLKIRLTHLTLTAAAFAAIATGVMSAGSAHAAIDDPWPEPPSCSNETGTCSSMEDIVAYECYFENPDSPFNFCDDPLEELQMKGGPKLVAPGRTSDSKLLLPAVRQ